MIAPTNRRRCQEPHCSIPRAFLPGRSSQTRFPLIAIWFLLHSSPRRCLATGPPLLLLPGHHRFPRLLIFPSTLIENSHGCIDFWIVVVQIASHAQL
jgi:hypothetical protein